MKAIDNFMRKGVEEGVFPSASLLISKNSKILFSGFYGDAKEDSVFDISSLTKPVSTATLCMIAVSRGLISPSDKVLRFFPEAGPVKSATIGNLLNHTSGLPAMERYYKKIPEEDIASKTGKKNIIEMVLKQPLEYKTGTACIYSDIGFMILGAVVEKVFSKPLNILFDEFVSVPLGLKSTFFRPITETYWSCPDFKPAYKLDGRDYEKISFVPTTDSRWRRGVIKGFVHDKNAFALGGVAGHAGLFSTAKDLQMFAESLVKNFQCDGVFLNNKVVKKFFNFAELEKIPSHTYLFGWDTPDRKKSQSGSLFSGKTIGHLGHTGCSMWVDLEKGISVFLLTNRIHPSSANLKIKEFRPCLHDEIWKTIGRS